ncbi:PQQ-dependent sugar dehydrogenase [Haloferula sp.]|uniref:PQQ-dependent sugar dehydrogenase n=1 Tax=Haloferula sp. TaxID=2497595 RepID=UPI00329EFE07
MRLPPLKIPPTKSSIGLFVLASISIIHAQIADPVPQALPAGFSVQVEPWLTIPASNLSSPTARINHLKPCPDGERLFCNDLRGKLWAIEDVAATSATEFLDLNDHFPSLVDSPGLGAGFMSFDFHPEFATTASPGFGVFYTSHTESASGTPDFIGPEATNTSQVAIVTEWSMSDADDPSIDLSPANFTRREILRVAFPFHIHGMQELSFDPNATPGSDNYGCLFICIGDGASVLIEIPDNVGRIDSAFGSIFRIAPFLTTGHLADDFTVSANGSYLIPESNPFFSSPDPSPGDGFDVVREIYAYGFRNPHRISWDSDGTGKMFCGNIGESSLEEVELIEPGMHYGWPEREGSFFFDPEDRSNVEALPFPDNGGFRYPVSQYDHDDGNAAIVGGFVYRGTNVPALTGKYVFGDIASGNLFVTDEADLVIPSVTSTGDTPAPPKSLGIKSAGTTTTFLAIIGSSRADLRFGIDHGGELYLLSKQNGTIYRVEPDPDPSGSAAAPIGEDEDWANLLDFESGEHELTTLPLSSAQVVDDPVEGASNRVLRIRSAGDSLLNAHMAIPEVPDTGYGTLFFRFLVTDHDHDAIFGVSDSSTPTSPADLTTELRTGDQNTSPPNLELRDDGSYASATSITPNQWYCTWLVIDNDHDVWDLYIQGGIYAGPTLIRSQVPFNASTIESLKSFFWQLSPATDPTTTSPVYFDDFHIDAGNLNTRSPLEARWHLVDHFESENPLDSWQTPDGSAQSLSIVTETDGNHHLARAASSTTTANLLAIAARKLPFATQVGESATLYFRARVDDSDLLQSIGLSAFNPPDPAAHTDSELSSQWRIGPSAALELYNGVPGVDDFVSTTPSAINTGEWYKFWLVCSNRGLASGGQTWRAWVQSDAMSEPTPLATELYFRASTEAPLTHFLSFATSLESAQNDPLLLDDIYLFPGATLDDPLGETPVAASIETISPASIGITSPTQPNRTVQLFTSEDLIAWSPMDEFADGDGDPFTFELPVETSRRFFQVSEPSPLRFIDSTWSTDFPGPGLTRGLQLSPGSTWLTAANLLTLDTNTSQLSGMVRRPGAYALVPGEWRNLDLTLEARTLESESIPQRDICLIFGYRDETHFYYAHLSSLSDGSILNVIMKVDGATRAPIQTPEIPFPAITSSWHSIRLTHSTNGEIKIFMDGDPTPLMEATDIGYPSGRVGFGSFDDSAEFRLFDISGQCR